MNKRLVCLGLSVLFFPTGAVAANCEDTGRRLNELASADQQIRQDWHMLEQNPNATTLEKDALHKRWRAIDDENLKQFKDVIARCGWPKDETTYLPTWKSVKDVSW